MAQLISELPYFSVNLYFDWQLYEERLQLYFVVNDISGDKRVAPLLSIVDPSCYLIVSHMCYPKLPSELKYEELVELIAKQFLPQESVYRNRAAFDEAEQDEFETIDQWFSRIKKLSSCCKYGENYEVILLNKFICGIRSISIQDRLCDEDHTLRLCRAIEIAKSMEESRVSDNDEIPDFVETNQN